MRSNRSLIQAAAIAVPALLLALIVAALYGGPWSGLAFMLSLILGLLHRVLEALNRIADRLDQATTRPSLSKEADRG